jgi:hypothetical protein
VVYQLSLFKKSLSFLKFWKLSYLLFWLHNLPTTIHIRITSVYTSEVFMIFIILSCKVQYLKNMPPLELHN